MLLGGGWPRGGWSAFKEGTEGLSFADRTSSALSSRVLTRPTRLDLLGSEPPVPEVLLEFLLQTPRESGASFLHVSGSV